MTVIDFKRPGSVLILVGFKLLFDLEWIPLCVWV